MCTVQWSLKAFDDLTNRELYDIVKVRCEVFIMEQEVTCMNDYDDKDQVSHHLFGYKEGKIVAYARILPVGISYDTTAIGRVLVVKEERGVGLAKELMERGIQYITEVWGEEQITISAQQYITSLYTSVGFEQISDVYDEDGIPHVKMRYTKI